MTDEENFDVNAFAEFASTADAAIADALREVNADMHALFLARFFAGHIIRHWKGQSAVVTAEYVLRMVREIRQDEALAEAETTIAN